MVQIFGGDDSSNTVLAIESKALPSQLENDIGPRLTRYMHNLLSSPASIERRIGLNSWVHSEKRIHTKDYEFVSAGAFHNMTMLDNNVFLNCNLDIAFAIRFDSTGSSAVVNILSFTELGSNLATLIHEKTNNTDLVSITLES